MITNSLQKLSISLFSQFNKLHKTRWYYYDFVFSFFEFHASIISSSQIANCQLILETNVQNHYRISTHPCDAHSWTIIGTPCVHMNDCTCPELPAISVSLHFARWTDKKSLVHLAKHTTCTWAKSVVAHQLFLLCLCICGADTRASQYRHLFYLFWPPNW